MQNIKKMSSISVTVTTRQKFAALGRKNESYDNLLLEIIDFIEKCDQWWAER